jgi:hypothetical protein
MDAAKGRRASVPATLSAHAEASPESGFGTSASTSFPGNLKSTPKCRKQCEQNRFMQIQLLARREAALKRPQISKPPKIGCGASVFNPQASTEL